MAATWKPVAVRLALLACLGCGPTAQQADPEQAQQTLTRALDAWRRGDSLESLRSSAPAVTVVEPHWQQGVRLVRYEVTSPGLPSGFDQQIVVKLSLQDRKGRPFQEKALYNVSSSPARVVVRSDGAG